jgi:hypothetical protein
MRRGIERSISDALASAGIKLTRTFFGRSVASLVVVFIDVSDIPKSAVDEREARRRTATAIVQAVTKGDKRFSVSSEREEKTPEEKNEQKFRDFLERSKIGRLTFRVIEREPDLGRRRELFESARREFFEREAWKAARRKGGSAC